LPDLKRSRRISGSLRSSSFIGTDFSFADLDRRDLREASTALQVEESIAAFSCYRISLLPSRSDSPYSRLELWIRKDNFLPLKIAHFDKSGVLLKEFRALEVKRVSGQWFVTRSRMTNVRDNHVTDLDLEQIEVDAAPDDVFTVRELEKM
jgi:negative regulator of sigma E activity